jgi:CheY-like chemotaxis protein
MTAKILIVDDVPSVGHTIARMLRGYETVVEQDPREALRRFERGEHFDIVLCDLQMPELTGREVYRALRSVERPPIVLMMSGHENVASLFAAGCPVLLKPFESDELCELVAAVLHEEPASVSPL